MSAKKAVAKVAKAKKPASRKAAPAKAAAAKRKIAAAPKAKAVKVALVKPQAKPKAPAAKAPAPVPPSVGPAAMKPAPVKPVRPAPPGLTRLPRPQPSAAPLRPATVGRPPTADGEDDSFDTGAGLLAGPRNVQPYLPKKGEQYMNAEQLEHFQHILLAWKRDLMEEVDRTVTHMKDEAANPPDPNDRATLESEFSLELRTRDRERKLIRKIDEALKRIEDGSYGYCLETGEEIGIKRLEARPVATLSLEAQERRERREKQYGDRDDRYR